MNMFCLGGGEAVGGIGSTLFFNNLTTDKCGRLMRMAQVAGFDLLLPMKSSAHR